ncbi:glycosyltransferase family 2 protein [Phenylobacterium terrae]|uniref:Glycosyltransferase family 2 protein n=1 Tax=Phenylobacterium terrae TaxID=2665495 RepID=A0ABW4MYT9_9CAUL
MAGVGDFKRLVGQAVGAADRFGDRLGGFGEVLRAVGRPVVRWMNQAGLPVAEQARLDPRTYGQWARAFDTLGGDERKAVAQAVEALPRRPVFSLVALGGADVAGLQAQIYSDWELILPAGAAAEGDPRIRTAAPGATAQAALAEARGHWIGLIGEGVRLRPHALAAVALALNGAPEAELAFADEDRLGPGGERLAPWFKPSFDLELMLGGQDLVGGGLALFRREALARVGGLRGGTEGAEAFDLALRIAGPAPARALHLPFVLAHRLAEAPDALAARRRCVQDFLQEHPLPHGAGRVEAAPKGGLRIAWPVPDPAPLVSIIVPTRDRAELLRTCAEGVLSRTDYREIELLIVDNGSVEPATMALFDKLRADPRVRVIEDPAPFNYSRLNNLAAREARGEVLVLLNNDIDVIGPGWLTELVGQALRPDVGAAGARLLFADGRVQHAGIALGIAGVGSYYHPYVEREARGYRDALVLTREVSAVTGACLALRREVYERVGGLEEEHLAVAFNDIDLCLKVREAGLRVVVTPFAELHHYESASRGRDRSAENRERYARESAYMRQRWGKVLDEDPFYNPNFSLRSGGFKLASPPRARKPWGG